MEERNWVWKSETGSRLVVSRQTPGQMIPTHRLASRPDASGETLTRPSRSDPGRFCTMWSMPSLEKWSWNECGKLDPTYTIQPDSGSMLAIMAITGRNQNASRSDLACLLGLNAVRVPQQDIKPSLALRERNRKRKPSMIFLKRMRKDHYQLDEHWNCFKGNIGETSDRWGGVCTGFSKCIHTILNWSEQSLNTLMQSLSLNTQYSWCPSTLDAASTPQHSIWWVSPYI